MVSSLSVSQVLAKIKTVVLSLLGAVLGRRVVLLAADAKDGARTLDASAPYRVDAPALAITVRHAERGRLTVEARGYAGHFPGELVWRSEPAAFTGGTATYTLDLAKGAFWHGVHQEGRGSGALNFPTRRFVLDLSLEMADGVVWKRRTGHYRPGGDRPVDASYFHGDNYVDHDAESVGDAADVLALLRAHSAGKRVLEIGCATGALVAAMRGAGHDAVGADFSEWAIGEARARLGGEHAWTWDLDAGAPPDALVARGPFDAVVTWVTLEHFREPWKALAAVSPLLAPGAKLFIKTTNADSLTRQLFGGDWEGYFDWTHHGVDAVGVTSLRAHLPLLGWRVRSVRTERIWDGNADPVHAALRDWWDADARFRALLAAKDLGDLVTVVAERT